jgi:HPt (histidine-containing phosphotransfer) domain-containing protein
MENILYDTQLVQQMSRGNTVFVKQILLVFTEDAAKAVVFIKQGIEENNYEAIGNHAHSLKSSIDLLNINPLKTVVRQIEQLAKDQSSMSQIEPLFQILETHISEVIVAIKKDIQM